MNPQPDSTPTASRGASEMTVIDRAALIEAAVQAVVTRPAIVHHFTETEAYARDDLDAALPVIAAGLLAPLRELHHGHRHGPYTCVNYGACQDLGFCAVCGRTFPCPTIRLLDQIEADCRGGE